jgi:hypothetical protein
LRWIMVNEEVSIAEQKSIDWTSEQLNRCQVYKIGFRPQRCNIQG